MRQGARAELLSAKWLGKEPKDTQRRDSVLNPFLAIGLVTLVLLWLLDVGLDTALAPWSRSSGY